MSADTPTQTRPRDPAIPAQGVPGVVNTSSSTVTHAVGRIKTPESNPLRGTQRKFKTFLSRLRTVRSADDEEHEPAAPPSSHEGTSAAVLGEQQQPKDVGDVAQFKTGRVK